MRGHAKRIIVLTMDSARHDYALHCLLKLCKVLEGCGLSVALFPHAYANGPGTVQSFVSMVTSTYFLVHASFHPVRGSPTLPKLASSQGFRSAAFHSNPLLSRRYGWGEGFHDFHYLEPGGDGVHHPSPEAKRRLPSRVLDMMIQRRVPLLNRVARVVSGLRAPPLTSLPYADAREVNKSVARRLRREGAGTRRLFLWVHYMGTHFPYAPLKEYFEGHGALEQV